MSKFMLGSKTTIEISNRDLRTVVVALETLAKDRGMPDHATAIALGKTIRRLRLARDDAAADYDILLNNHARRDDDGRIMRPSGGSGDAGIGVQLEDPAAFLKEQRALDKHIVEVEVYPIPCAKLKTGKQKGVCPRCKQITGMPDPEALATLVDLGIFTEEDAEEDGVKEDAE